MIKIAIGFLLGVALTITAVKLDYIDVDDIDLPNSCSNALEIC
ncbi:hypothetical protein [Vibrio owensii]